MHDINLLHLLAESLLYLDILCDHEKSSKIMHCIAISHDQGGYIFDTFNSYALHASYIQHVSSAINALITLRILRLVKIPFSHFSDQRSGQQVRGIPLLQRNLMQ